MVSIAVAPLPMHASAASPMIVATTEAQPAVTGNGTRRLLQRAVGDASRRADINLLFAIRQLRDPAAQPLFFELVQRDDPEVQVQAVLALAELADPPAIDPWLLTQLRPEATELALASAADLDLLPSARVHEILALSDLPERSRMLLLAELSLRGEKPDAASLRELTSDANVRVAGLAAAVLHQHDDAGAFAPMRERIAKLEAPEREATWLWLLEAFRQFKLTGMADEVESLITDPESSEIIVFEGIYALLGLNAERGLAQWQRHLGPEPRPASRIRYGLMLLASDAAVPASAFDPLRSDEPLSTALANVGAALRNQKDEAKAFTDLFATGHPAANGWSLAWLDEKKPAYAPAVYRAIINRVKKDDVNDVDDAANAVVAVTELWETDPEWITEQLQQAKDDSARRRVLLLGLLEVNDPTVVLALQDDRPRTAGKTDSLALVLYAKASPEITTEEVQQLRLIAEGGGRLSIPLQMQAAWLYLRHTDQLQDALASMLHAPGADARGAGSNRR